VFLQYVDSNLWDVVVLKKCARNSYLLGVEGIASDFFGLVDYVGATVSAAHYRRVMTFGPSGGGFAAAWAAALMGANRGISVCGGVPNPPPSLASEDERPPRGVDLCFVFGADNARDHQSALALMGLFGGRLRPIPGIPNHGVLGRLMKRGQLGEFLDEMLA